MKEQALRLYLASGRSNIAARFILVGMAVYLPLVAGQAFT